MKPRIPDRFSIITYLSQFYHKFGGSRSESCPSSSSSSHSPASSDGEAERTPRRNISYGPRRGAIQSLMDGRRARSVSGHLRRGGGGDETRDTSLALEQENPFKDSLDTPLPVDMAAISPRKRQKRSKQANTDQQEYLTENNDKHSGAHVNTPEDKLSKTRAAIPVRKSALSFTPHPTPYQSKLSPNTTSLLSQTQAYLSHRKYQRSQSQPTRQSVQINQKTDYRKSLSLDNNPVAVNASAPVKPKRTFLTEARNKKDTEFAASRDTLDKE